MYTHPRDLQQYKLALGPYAPVAKQVNVTAHRLPEAAESLLGQRNRYAEPWQALRGAYVTGFPTEGTSLINSIRDEAMA